jgi:hypothetical protein
MNGPEHYAAGEVQLENAVRHFNEHPADMAIAKMAARIAQAHFTAALATASALPRANIPAWARRPRTAR